MSLKAKIYRAFGVECTIQEIANAMCVTDQSVRNQINKGTLEAWLNSKGVYSSIELMDILGRMDPEEFERQYEERKSAELEALGFTPFGEKGDKTEEIQPAVDVITDVSEPKQKIKDAAEPVINPFSTAESSTADTDIVPVQHDDADCVIPHHVGAACLERYNAAIDALTELIAFHDRNNHPEQHDRIVDLRDELRDRRAYDFGWLVDWEQIAKAAIGID